METKHLIVVLKEARHALKERDVAKLKKLSNQTIHSASIDQDDISIAVAVIIYSLSKIIERPNYQEYPEWNAFVEKSMECMQNAISSLQKEDKESLRSCVKEVEVQVDKLTGRLKEHIQQVFEKAKINKASRIYEHGISMEKTADLLGISIFELADYVGKTGISDVNLSKTLPIKERLSYMEELFS